MTSIMTDIKSMENWNRWIAIERYAPFNLHDWCEKKKERKNTLKRHLSGKTKDEQRPKKKQYIYG